MQNFSNINTIYTKDDAMGLRDWLRNILAADADMSEYHGGQDESPELAGLDFQAAIAAHQKWKVRLQACIDGTSQETLDPRTISRDDQCVLGKWINGHGSVEFGNKTAFSQLKIEHAQFHMLAGEVLLAVYSGRQAEAKEKLESLFTQASLRVQKLLANLFLDARR
jgi:hypothetical protein